jgi:6-phosphogluconolactonase (cycloisomerase 2 family)
MKSFRFTPLFIGSLSLALWASPAWAADPQSEASTPALQTAAPKFLYSTDYSGGKVHGYLVSPSTGAITPTGQNPPGAHRGPTRTVSDKGGNRLYVINYGSKDIDAYFIYRNDGYIYKIPGSPFAIGQVPTNVAVHPSGHFVYVTAKNNAVYAFSVESNGSLKLVAGSPFPTQNDPEALAIDPDGHYLYTNDAQKANKIDAFSINQTDGALTPVPGSPFAQTPNPCDDGSDDMAIDSSGKFLILPQYCTGTEVYRIDSASGSIAQVPGSPFPVPANQGPQAASSIAVDPLDRWIFIETEICDSGCSASTETYAFNKTTGAMTFLESGLGDCGEYVRADPSGKFLYAIGQVQACDGGTPSSPSAILGLSINQSKGSVSSVPGSPFKSPNLDDNYYVGLVITP